MFPLWDENPTETTPYVTLAIIALCVLVWVILEGAGFSENALVGSICHYGLIPAELTGRAAGYSGVELAPGVPCRFGDLGWTTLLTSMFLHGSWFHLIGNMWFFWVFGNNIEDSMGHIRFLIFYLVCGVIAGLVYLWMSESSAVPTVGASGAISGIMGAYLLLYPRVRVKTLFVLLIFISIIAIPAWVILIEWFVLQVLYWVVGGASSQGGVAVGAHVGGFVAGLVLVKLFENRKLVEARTRKRLRGQGPADRPGW